MTINSVTERNDRTHGGKELLASVDSGAVDNVLPRSVCTEYHLEATSRKRTGHTSSTMGSDVFESDVRKPLISASRLLERGHKLALDEKPRIQCKSGDTIPLERTGSSFAVRLWIPKSFHRQG